VRVNRRGAIVFCLMLFAALAACDRSADPPSAPSAAEALIQACADFHSAEKTPAERCRLAERTLLAALTDHPKSDALHTKLGFLYLNAPLQCGEPGLFGNSEKVAERISEHLQTAAKRNPKNAGAQRGLVRHFLWRDPPRSLAAAERLATLEPKDEDARRLLGMALFENGELARAEAIFQVALASPDEAGQRQAHEFLGRIYLKQDKLAEAKKHLVAAADGLDAFVRERQNYWGCPYQALGALYGRLAQPTKKAENFVKAAELESQDDYTQYDAALACYAVGDLDQAARFAKRAIALQDRPRFRKLAAKITLRAAATADHTWPEADTDLTLETALDAFEAGAFDLTRRLLDHLPAEAGEQAATVRGFLALYEQKPEAAREAFARGGDGPGAKVGAGHAALVAKNYAEAEMLLTAALAQLGPDATEAADKLTAEQRYARFLTVNGQLGLAWAAANRNEHDKALPFYERILAVQPEHLLALVGMGNSLTGLQQLDRAEQVFGRALALYPENPYVLAELALVKFNRGELDEAEQMFNAALAGDDSRYTCPYEGLGLVQLRRGDFAAARKNFERAIALNPDIEYKKFNGLAKIFLKEGKLDQAEKLLRKSIENYPYDDEARELLALVQERRHETTPE
jgi:tetratricopeptide (TPR) repeat protein